MSAAIRRALAIAVALLAALLITSALLRATGRAPATIYALLLAGTWGNAYGIGQVLFKATPLLLCGASVAVALRAGLFNVGAEGQLILGAFACAWVGAALPAATSAAFALPACLVASAAGGAALGCLAGWLKARRGAHEVITTIMLNFIVRAAMVGAGTAMFVRESVHTRPIVAGAAVGRLDRLLPALHGSAANFMFPASVVVVVALFAVVSRTRFGFHLRAVGAQPRVATTAGLDVGRVTIAAMALAGALAGLGGANFVLGYKRYYEEGFSGGVGFVGIAVAVLGGAGPLSLVAAALLFGTLAQGALAVNAVCPKEIIDVLQTIVVIAVAAAVAVRPGRGAKGDP